MCRIMFAASTGSNALVVGSLPFVPHTFSACKLHSAPAAARLLWDPVDLDALSFGNVTINSSTLSDSVEPSEAVKRALGTELAALCTAPWLHA